VTAPAPAPQPGVDPVRQRHIDAMQRRATQYQGLARQVIDARLRQLQGAPAAPRPARPVAESTVPAGHRALSDLLAHIARHTAPAGELRAVHDHRGTWARLGLEQRLRQTSAQVPDNAGPLNTQRLLHQALTLMRTASPAYLQHFMAHAETLLALEALGQAPAEPKRDTARRVRKRSTPR
jgi:Protein of unknown function (DUF2894)